MSRKPSRELVAMVDNVVLEVVLVAVGIEVVDIEVAAHEPVARKGAPNSGGVEAP